MEAASRVHFDLTPKYCYYEASNDNKSLGSYRSLQESMDRSRGEYASFQTRPETQLHKTSQVFGECRNHDITIIFGNLGRHPLLLTYFLDFIFTSRESVATSSAWDMDSPYQIKPPFPALDFLFVIEPYFGYSVVKPSQVKHLIVLTSHLLINVSDCHMTKLYLAPPFESTPCVSKSYVSFKPPVFHDGKVNQFPPKKGIQLDVTNVASSHEAFLRLLTGREIARDRNITIQLSPRDQERIQTSLTKSQNKAVSLGWQEEWIHQKYLNLFNNTEEKSFNFKKTKE